MAAGKVQGEAVLKNSVILATQLLKRKMNVALVLPFLFPLLGALHTHTHTHTHTLTQPLLWKAPSSLPFPPSPSTSPPLTVTSRLYILLP